MNITSTQSPNSTNAVTNWLVRRGEYVSVPIVYKDSTGTAVNITGYTIKMRIESPTPVELSTPTGIVITNAANGAFSIIMTSATTNSMSIGTYFYDLWLIDGSSHPTPILSGSFTVEERVTTIS